MKEYQKALKGFLALAECYVGPTFSLLSPDDFQCMKTCMAEPCLLLQNLSTTLPLEVFEYFASIRLDNRRALTKSIQDDRLKNRIRELMRAIANFCHFLTWRHWTIKQFDHEITELFNKEYDVLSSRLDKQFKAFIYDNNSNIAVTDGEIGTIILGFLYEGLIGKRDISRTPTTDELLALHGVDLVTTLERIAAMIEAPKDFETQRFCRSVVEAWLTREYRLYQGQSEKAQLEAINKGLIYKGYAFVNEDGDYCEDVEDPGSPQGTTDVQTRVDLDRIITNAKLSSPERVIFEGWMRGEIPLPKETRPNHDNAQYQQITRWCRENNFTRSSFNKSSKRAWQKLKSTTNKKNI